MSKLIFSRTALHDLKRLRAFIAEQNPSAATKIANKLKQSIERLKDFPRMGQPVENLPEVRELVAANYVVRYQVSNDRIDIIKIWHGRENRYLG